MASSTYWKRKRAGLCTGCGLRLVIAGLCRACKDTSAYRRQRERSRVVEAAKRCAQREGPGPNQVGCCGEMHALGPLPYRLPCCGRVVG